MCIYSFLILINPLDISENSNIDSTEISSDTDDESTDDEGKFLV